VKCRFGFGPLWAPGRLWLPIACAAALVLGLLRLGGAGLWIDEIYTARWAALPWRELFGALAGSLHPPLFFALERLVIQAAGDGEAGLRLLSLLAGVGAVAMSFWAFRPVLNQRAAAATAWLLALSPQFFLYARMACYYALATLLAMAAHGLFVRLAVRRGRPRSWALYAVVSALMLLTSYLSLCLVLAHGVWAIFARRRPGLWKRWLAATAGAAFLLSPWLIAVAAARTRQLVIPAVSPPAEWALLLGYDFHALTASELLYPWEPLGAVGILCGGWLLLMGGLAAVRRGLGRSVLLPALAALVLSWAIVSTLQRATPFVGLPARTLFLWPFAAVVMALGILDSAQHRSLRWAATAGVAAAWLTGWVHLYRLEHFMNPIYLTPGREVAADLARDVGPGDAVLAEDDSGVNYYFVRLNSRVPLSDPVDTAAVSVLLGPARIQRVWWVRLSRDGSVRARPAGRTQALLGGWGRLEERKSYLEIDPAYRAVKRLALGMPGYQHRLVVERYRRRGTAEGEDRAVQNGPAGK